MKTKKMKTSIRADKMLRATLSDGTEVVYYAAPIVNRAIRFYMAISLLLGVVLGAGLTIAYLLWRGGVS